VPKVVGVVLEEEVLARVPQEGLAAVVRAEPGREEVVEVGAPDLDWRWVGRLTPRLGAGLLGWTLVEVEALELSKGWVRATLPERVHQVPLGVQGRVWPALLTHR